MSRYCLLLLALFGIHQTLLALWGVLSCYYLLPLSLFGIRQTLLAVWGVLSCYSQLPLALFEIPETLLAVGGVLAWFCLLVLARPSEIHAICCAMRPAIAHSLFQTHQTSHQTSRLRGYGGLLATTMAPSLFQTHQTRYQTTSLAASRKVKDQEVHCWQRFVDDAICLA